MAKPFSTAGTIASTSSLSRRLDLRPAVDAEPGGNASLRCAPCRGSPRAWRRARSNAACSVSGVRRVLRDVGGEATRADPAAAHLGQIDPARAVLERVGALRPGYVDMRIERQQRTVEGDGIGDERIMHGITLPPAPRRRQAPAARTLKAGSRTPGRQQGSRDGPRLVGRSCDRCPESSRPPTR